jgi:cyclic pyranopterin phosphate synthase
MVDVSQKPDTLREAVARGHVTLSPRTISLIAGGKIPKGNVLNTARIAGILAAKRVYHLIPLCHPLCLAHVSVDFETSVRNSRGRIDIAARARLVGKTGVEMEALAAVSVAALTIYDMCKAVDGSMRISGIHLVSKRGGSSGRHLQPRMRRTGRIEV